FPSARVAIAAGAMIAGGPEVFWAVRSGGEVVEAVCLCGDEQGGPGAHSLAQNPRLPRPPGAAHGAACGAGQAGGRWGGGGDTAEGAAGAHAGVVERGRASHRAGRAGLQDGAAGGRVDLADRSAVAGGADSCGAGADVQRADRTAPDGAGVARTDRAV